MALTRQLRLRLACLRQCRTVPKFSDRQLLEGKEWNGKAFLENAVAQWIPKGRLKQKWSPDVKRTFEQQLRWFRPWVTALRAKRRRRGASYDARSFTREHHKFKEQVLDCVEKFALGDGRGKTSGSPWRRDRVRLAYLDAGDGAGRLRVTTRMQRRGMSPQTQLFCANPCGRIAESLQRVGVNALRCCFAEALGHASWPRTFHVVYLDFCTNDHEKALADVGLLRNRLVPQAVLGVTLACGRPSTQGDLLESWIALDKKLEDLGFFTEGTLGDHTFHFRPKQVCTRFYRFRPTEALRQEENKSYSQSWRAQRRERAWLFLVIS